MYDFSKSPLIRAQYPRAGKLTLLSRMLFLILVYFAANILSSLPSYIAMLSLAPREFARVYIAAAAGSVSQSQAADNLSALFTSLSTEPLVSLAQLFGTVAMIGATILFAVCADGRTFASLGLRTSPRKGVLCYLGGAFAGALMLSAALGICVAVRAAAVNAEATSFLWVFLFLPAFLIQGFAEEIFIHGYVMTVFLAPGRNVWVGVGISSFLFAFLHLGNDGISFIAILNLCLFGMLAGLLTLRTGNLWAAAGLHSLWNFMQGNFFGISVSGGAPMPSVFRSVLFTGSETVNGGAFGLEGGIVVTLVILLGILAVMYLPARASGKNAGTASDNSQRF